MKYRIYYKWRNGTWNLEDMVFSSIKEAEENAEWVMFNFTMVDYKIVSEDESWNEFLNRQNELDLKLMC